jgi:hypothetical protein
MKKIFLMMMITACNTVLAQDIFQENFYMPELVLKYWEEAGLSADQVEKIKEIYNRNLPNYDSKKWHLDAEMVKLEKLITESAVDVKASVAQLVKSLEFEADIKKMKLEMLVKVKNILTPEQQAKLDVYRRPARIGLNGKQNAKGLLGGTKDLLTSGKALFHIIDGSEDKMVTEFPKDIAPEDIESIQVIRGEGATAKYGTMGENGVVVLTLKKKK